MIERLPPVQRRWLALAILCALLLLLAGAVWLPFAFLGRQATALSDAQRQLEALRARVPVRDELLAREEELGRSGNLSEALLTGSTPAVAAAQLQGDLSSLAAQMGGEIVTIQIFEPEETPPFVRIGLRLTMNGDTATMRDFLYAIETRSPILIVSALALTAPTPDVADAPSDPLLSATLEIHGYAPRSVLR